MAAKLKIDLLNLVDTDDAAIKTKLLSHAAVVNERVAEWSLSIEGALRPAFP
jgi:hypothetical protein